MKKFRFLLPLVLCSLSVLSQTPVYSDDSEPTEEEQPLPVLDVSSSSFKPYSITGDNPEFIEHLLSLNKKEFLSSSEEPLDKSGNVISANYAGFDIDTVIFHDIFSTKSGSVINGIKNSLLTELKNSNFYNNGVIVNDISTGIVEDINTYLMFSGGAVNMEYLYNAVNPEGGADIIHRGDIGEINNTYFSNNFIEVNSESNADKPIKILGGAVNSNNIAYLKENDKFSTFYLPETSIEIPPESYNKILGGIINSGFSENKINTNIKNGNKYLDLTTGGAAVNANYIRQIDGSNFNNNAMETNVNIAQTAIVSTNGGIINSSGVSEIKNSNFNENMVKQITSSDSAHNSITGGVVSNNLYNTNTISNSNFNNNNITSSATGKTGAYIDVDGGVYYAAVKVNNFNSNSMSGNNINLASDANKQGGTSLYGGVLFTPSIGNISSSSFNSNNITMSSDGSVNGYGGIILDYIGTDVLEKSNFENNNITLNGTAYGSSISLVGGLIQSGCIHKLDNTIFGNNKITVNAAENSAIDIVGGVVNNYLLQPNTTTLPINITNTVFKDNNIIINDEKAASTMVIGPTLSIIGELDGTIKDSSFTGNKATSKNPNAEILGGALYNDAFFENGLTVTDTEFQNNSATKGGAIYSAKNMTIYSDKKDIVFKGNTAKQGADIYIDASDMSLITNSKDRTIAINGGVTLGNSTAANVPSLTAKGEGTFSINAPINYEGTGYGTLKGAGNTVLDVKKDEYLNSPNLKLALSDKVKLNLINDKGSKISLYDLDVQSDTTSIQMDLNLDGTQSDYLDLKSPGSTSTGKINVTKINLLSEAVDKNQTIKVASSNNEVNINYTGYTNTNKYVIKTNDTQKDRVDITRENDTPIDGFANSIVDTAATEFTAMSDVVTDLSTTGNQLNKDFYIKARNHSIDFSGKDNIDIAATKKLTIDNASVIKNSGDSALNVGAGSNLDIVASKTDTAIQTNVKLNSDTSIVNLKLSNGRSAKFTGTVTGENTSKGQILLSNGNVDFAKTKDIRISAKNSNVNIYDEAEQVELIVEDSHLNLKSPVAYSAINSQRSIINVPNETYLNNSNLVMNNSNMNIVNNTIGTMDIDTLTLTGTNNISVDVDLAELKADKINPKTVVADANSKLNVSEFNIVKNTTITGGTVSITDNEELKKHTSTTVSSVENGIYKYDVRRTSNGDFNFAATKYDPAILVGPMAQQAQYATQLNSYNQAFNNMDMIMLKPYSERMAARYQGRIAINDDNPDSHREYYHHYRDYHPADYEKGPWFKPYGSIENIRFHNGPKINNYMYGATIGYDSNLLHLKNGVDTVMSGYVSYNGSMQDYKSVKIHQNGATAGVSAAFYKNNFFTGITANGAVSLADANNSHGSEDFTMISAGTAVKSGYNFETEGGMFIFQPSVLASYTFVNNPDYTNATGLRIKSDVLNAVQLEPGVKFIFNFENHLQTYLGASAIFTILGQSDFTAANVSLPKLSYEPYGYYKLGVQKAWGERSLGFAQTGFRSGGRNGAELQLGWRFAI